MKGLELARAFYDEYGAPMLEERFPELAPYICAGLVGSGSECYGYDDEVSRDHDFEPGFCLFIPDENITGEDGNPLIDSRAEFRLSRAYASLPKEYLGFRRNLINPVGGSRHGVIRMGDFWKKAVGAPDGVLDVRSWLSLPEYALAEAINGEIFRDDLGLFSAIRRGLRRYPEDIRKKKIAGYLLIMEQSGEYNYPRTLSHGETGAAQLAVYEFVKASMHVAFLLGGEYMPYYKWAFRALKETKVLPALAKPFEELLSTPNDESSVREKKELIGHVSSVVAKTILLCDIADIETDNLERLAYAVNDRVKDPTLRTMNILAGVE